MSRSLSFGYNAAVGVSDRVLDHLVGATYEHPDAEHVIVRDLAPYTSGEAHLWYSKPSLTIDDSREGKHVVVCIDRLLVHVFVEGTPAPSPFDISELEAGVVIWLALDKTEEGLRLAFADVAEDDVDVTIVHCTPDSDDRRTTAESLLKQIIVEELASGRLDNYGDIPINLDHPLLRSTPSHRDNEYNVKFDVNVADDRTAADRDLLGLAAYEEFTITGGDIDPGLRGPHVIRETRGDPDNVRDFLEQDKSFSVQLSKAVIDYLIADAVNARFMRFSVRVEAEEHVENRVEVSAPASGVVTLTGRVHWGRTNVGGKVSNPRTEEAARLRSGQDGSFKVHIGAQIGDVLELHGTLFEAVSDSGSMLVYPPDRVVLQDGHIEIEGKAYASYGLSFWVYFEGTISLSIDPISGNIKASVDADAHLPPVIEMLLLMLSNVFYPIVRSGYDERTEDEIETSFVGRLTRLNLNLSRPGLMVAFTENIEVRSDGIILSGQIEAGRIRESGCALPHRGVMPPPGVYLDVLDGVRDVNPPLSEATFMCAERGLGRSRWPRWVFSVQTSSWSREVLVSCHSGESQGLGIVDLGPPGSAPAFEDLTVDDLRELSYDNIWVRYAWDGMTPAGTILDRHVFAVRSAWGRLAKVRINAGPAGEPILRWVTYEAPRIPTLEIGGTWCKSMRGGTFSKGIIVREVRGADRYWGNLEVTLENLHDKELAIQWEILSGPGTLVVDNDGLTAHLVVDTTTFGADPHSPHATMTTYAGDFTTVVQVEATDIFGRTASARRSFNGCKQQSKFHHHRHYERGPAKAPYPDEVIAAHDLSLEAIASAVARRIKETDEEREVEVDVDSRASTRTQR